MEADTDWIRYVKTKQTRSLDPHDKRTDKKNRGKKIENKNENRNKKNENKKIFCGSNKFCSKPINIPNFKQASQTVKILKFEKSINLIDREYFEPRQGL